MAKNTTDPWAKDFDYDAYKKKWVEAVKQPVVILAIIGCAIGICLALSTIAFPDWSLSIRARAIIAFVLCFACSEVAKQNMQAYLTGFTTDPTILKNQKKEQERAQAQKQKENK